MKLQSPIRPKDDFMNGSNASVNGTPTDAYVVYADAVAPLALKGVIKRKAAGPVWGYSGTFCASISSI